MTVKTYRIVYHKDCGACRYFQRHYVRLGKKAYHAMDYGHCMKRRIRRRHAREVCPDWKSRAPLAAHPFLPDCWRTYHPPKEDPFCSCR